ncbi:MAG: biopolymer transporter ExbD [Bacteroidales bacterium]
MSKFKQNEERSVPELNMASMSDIIFMLLFFFMVITTMREVSLIVRVSPPQATEVQRLERKSLVSFIYVGKPIRTQLGTESRIQLNDAFATVNDISSFIIAERQARPESDRPLLTTSLKVDASTKMGIVTDIKQELRKTGAFKITYSTRKRGKSANS